MRLFRSREHCYCLLVITQIIIYVVMGMLYVSTRSWGVTRSPRQTTQKDSLPSFGRKFVVVPPIVQLGTLVCPPGWKKMNYKCYKQFYQTLPISYDEVITRCDESEAWPIIVSTPPINAFIHEMMNDYGLQFGPVFVGLTYNATKQEFEWHDGTNLTFTDWAKGEPNHLKHEKCAEITVKSMKWNNIPCDVTSRRCYACEKFANRVEEAAIRVVPCEPAQYKQMPPGVFTDEMFENSLVSGFRKNKTGFMTIGIPTVHRPDDMWYLNETLDSLIKHSSDADRKDMTVVIFLADSDVNQRLLLDKKILNAFQKYVDSGFIQTIEAPESFYPSFRNIKRTYNHELTQVKWRSKQNFDYAYLMHYSKTISKYYLQLEDDVFTINNYFGIIKTFMKEMNLKAMKNWYSKEWSCLEFSDLGFIAKLFQSKEISKLAALLTLFYNEQPNDVLYLHFNEIMLQFDRHLRKPTIFQHFGLQSSLVLKKEAIVDIYFASNMSVDPKGQLLPVKKRLNQHILGPEAQPMRERLAEIRKRYC